jgi:endonuclease/exonuclease/phosphatase (EEP) superfamily protein YafD
MMVLAWFAVATFGVAVLATWAGFTLSRFTKLVLYAHAAYQLAFVWMAVASVLVFGATLVLRSRPLSGAALVVAIAHLLLVAPLVTQESSAPKWAASAPTTSVAYANALFTNRSNDEIVQQFMAADADVIVVVELTETFVDAAQRGGLNDRYPFQQLFPQPSPAGEGIWSKTALQTSTAPIWRDTPDVLISVGTQQVRIVAAHPIPPISNARLWRQQMAAFGELDPAATLLIGDFNSTRFHPPMRTLLNNGWRDAHEVLGQGFSRSWPQDGLPLIGGVGRIDHALFGSGTFPMTMRALAIPGSDHQGFVATFAVAQTN